jgi:hypothetical protein
MEKILRKIPCVEFGDTNKSFRSFFIPALSQEGPSEFKHKLSVISRVSQASFGKGGTYETVALIVTDLAVRVQSTLKDLDSGLWVIRHTQYFSL